MAGVKRRCGGGEGGSGEAWGGGIGWAAGLASGGACPNPLLTPTTCADPIRPYVFATAYTPAHDPRTMPHIQTHTHTRPRESPRCMSPHAYHTLLHLIEKIPRSIIRVRDACGPISQSH